MASLTLTLLGGFQARAASGQAVVLPTKKAQALLAYLALHPGQAHPRDKLAALLWGDRSDEQARNSLRQTLFTLRKALSTADTSALLIEGENLALNPSAVAVDVATFERLAAEGTPAAYEQAAALYQGDLLEGLGVTEATFEEWLRAERERFRELALELLAKLLAHKVKDKETESAIQTALRLLALDPLQEAAHRTLMRLYARQGRQGAALRQYQICMGVLQRELGVEPEAETRQLYQDILQQRPSPSHTIETSPVHAARRRRLGPGRARPKATTREAFLVGRKEELDRLRQAFQEACKGRGQIAMVLGEAGIGKTRLVEELAAEGAEQGAWVLFGRSYEMEQILAFRPWVDALRTGRVISDEQMVEALGPVWRLELARLFPELGGPGLPAAGAPEDYLRLFEALAQLLGRVAARRPLLLILEDLHWADEMSLRLLAFLGRRVSAWPALIVATAREEEFAGAPIFHGFLQDTTRDQSPLKMVLPALSCQDTVTLVRALARPGDTESSVATLGEKVWTASGGNPFVIVETMRALQEGMGPHEPPHGLRVPDRVREVIVARIQRLSERSRHLVAVAAVIGREFDFALLQRAAEFGEAEAAEAVEDLVRRRVLHVVGERFDFTHGRIQGVAYDHLLPPRRKLLHGLVAKSFEDLYAENLESHYAALAVHTREAGMWGKALAYFRLAGTQAAARSAHREAVACFEHALDAMQHVPETPQTLEQTIDLCLDLRNSFLALGELDKIPGYLAKAEMLARKLDDRRRLAWVSIFMSAHLNLTGHPTKARVFGESALAIAEALEDFPLHVGATYYLGLASLGAGDYHGSGVFLRKIVHALEGDGSRQRYGLAGFPAVMARAWLAYSLGERGEFTGGIGCGREAVSLAETLDHPYSTLIASWNLAYVYSLKGDLSQAVPLLEHARALSARSATPFFSPLILWSLGYTSALSGRLGEGLSLLEQALPAVESLGLGFFHCLALVHVGEACVLADRLEDALACADRALEVARERGERGYEAYGLRLLGAIASRRDPPAAEAADRHYRQASALAHELEMRPLLAHCHLGLGTLWRRTKGLEASRTEVSAAIELFRSMEMTHWLMRAEAVLAREQE